MEKRIREINQLFRNRFSCFHEIFDKIKIFSFFNAVLNISIEIEKEENF